MMVEQTFIKHTKNDRSRLLDLVMPEPDLLHLNERGHDLYFRTVYPGLERVVSEFVNNE